MKYQNEINEVLAHGGYLCLGRCSWSLSIGEKKLSATSSQSSCLSGYYNIHGECPDNLINRCIDANIPVIDSRKMTLSEAFEYIKGPLVHCSKNYEMPSDKISLQTFKELKKHLTVTFYNI